MTDQFRMFDGVDVPPRVNKYSKGFEKAYLAWGKAAHKSESYEEWKKQGLDQYADYISARAFLFHLHCRKTNRIQCDLRRWLLHQGWEDDIPEEVVSYKTPQQASNAFKKGEWTHLDSTDCREMKVKWNSQGLYVGDRICITSSNVGNAKFSKREA